MKRQFAISHAKWIAVIIAALALPAVAIPLAAGGTISSPHGNPDDVAREPVPLEAARILTSGSVNDTLSWKLLAYQSDRGICVDVALSGTRNLVSGGCGFAKRGIGVARTYIPAAGLTWIYGPAASEAASVKVSATNGRTVSARTIAQSSGDRSFYVATVAGDVGVESIAAVDRKGETLDRVTSAEIGDLRP